MVTAANLGFPRIGRDRELKKAVEAYWKGDCSAEDLRMSAKQLRMEHWRLQKEAGIQHIPSNDFSFYDQVLDMITLVGAVPSRYGFGADKKTVDLDTYFAMARGRQSGGQDVVAMEMTKWFDTNYHYIVPEFEPDQEFRLTSSKPVEEFNEAKGAGITTRPVLIGPVSFLLLGKMRSGEGDPVSLLHKLLPVYEQILRKLEDAGVDWVQIDEPYLALDLTDAQRQAFHHAYNQLSKATKLKLLVATYFDGLKENMGTAFSLPVQAVHIDLVRAPEQLVDALDSLPDNKKLSLGVIDGRNIWKSDLEAAAAQVQAAVDRLGSDRVMVAPSCSLLHSPVDLAAETALDDELKSWLAFARQKLDEVAVIARAINNGRESVAAALDENKTALAARHASPRIHNDTVKQRASRVTEDMTRRKSPFDQRIAKQQAHLNLPLLPTTTIGSLPQTQEIRKARAQFKKGALSAAEYDAFLREQTIEAMRFQDEIGIDVPVHGEYERNDMVEYFGEQLSGFAFTKNGWVQSYGSRCVKPPVIFGDVSREQPMTVEWSGFAQKQTERPVKGMLTGPITILQWSFVRDDQPRSETCKQIALAIRDEVTDLEKAGIHIIQVDEPAIREGLPLRNADQADYLAWAVEAFRLSAGGAADETQIHTHMCYAEFNDIIDSIAALDADVISIETSRSAMELLEAFTEFNYPNQIGPGVYDIHSPRVPKTEEMVTLLQKALKVLKPEQVWVNPDCGLKTRGWAEVRPALENMVEAARIVREEAARKQAA